MRLLVLEEDSYIGLSLLTADLGGVTEGLFDLWIQMEKKLVLFSNLTVARVDLLFDPAFKAFSTYSVGNVYKPLARHSSYVGTLWHVRLKLRVFRSLLNNFLNRQSGVVGHKQMLDLV